MAQPSSFSSLRDRKLVVLGIPYDVETEELKYYMCKFGELEDCIVMKDRGTGQSRGFGYVTFMTVEDARKATAAQHVLNGRTLDVKVATPREEMWPSGSRKINRIFVARIPPSVTEDMFRSYFQKYGAIVDAYMPKEMGSRSHRGIGFVTFENPDSVDKLMNETHELGGSTIAVDRATPKEETLKFWGKSFPDQYSLYNAYMAAAAAAAAQYGAFPMAGPMGGYDFTGFGFGGDAGFGGQESTGGADNTWESFEGGMGKSPSSAGAPAATTSAAGYGSAASPSGAPAAIPGAGYGASAPHSDAMATNASAGFGSDASNRAAPNAAAPFWYGSGAPYNNIQGMAAFVSGYGASAQPAATCPAGYASGASDGSTLNSAIPNDGYGYGSTYGGASMVPAASVYGATGSFSGAQAAPTTGPGIVSNASESGASALQSYPAEYGSVGPYNGPSDNPSGAGALYNSAPDGPTPGSGYVSNASYSAAPTAPAPGAGYGSTASYGVAPAPAASASGYGSNGPAPMGNKVFIGRLPMEATAEHLRTYFSSFGRILDVYVPKDAKKKGHRGFGFVTFFDDGIAEQVALQSHEILGQPIAVDRPTPQDSGANMPYPSNPSAVPSTGGAAAWGNTPAFQRMGYGSLPASFDYFSGGWAPYAGGRTGAPASSDEPSANRSSRTDARYKPY